MDAFIIGGVVFGCLSVVITVVIACYLCYKPKPPNSRQRITVRPVDMTGHYYASKSICYLM